MKKNLLYSAMAFAMALAGASCSQDEVIDNASTQGGLQTIQVKVGDGANTRTLPTSPGTDYKLRCIMQVVNGEGKVIEDTDGKENFRQAVFVTSDDNLTFTFTEPEDAGYKVLFWADYVPATQEEATDNLYNTAAFPNVSYNAEKLSEKEHFNSTAADAFFACVQAKSSSATLTRPFARLNIRVASDVAETYKDYTHVAGTVTVPGSFDLLNGKPAEGTSATSATLNLDADTQAKYWFNFYVFASTDANSTLGTGNDMNFTLTGSGKEDLALEVKGENVQFGDNVSNKHGYINVTPGTDNSTTIKVEFPGDMEDPDAPKPLAIGQYIYKDGTNGTEYNANAVAIVWKVVTDGGTAVGDAASNYTAEANGTDMSGKEIAGYAFAIDYSDRSILGTSTTMPTFTSNTTDDNRAYKNGTYNALANSNAMEKAIKDVTNGEQAEDYKKLLSAINISSENISKWYIPSYKQLVDFCGALMGQENPAIEIDQKVLNAFNATQKDISQKDTTNSDDEGMDVYFASSNILDATHVSNVTITHNANVAQTTWSYSHKESVVVTTEYKTSIRPVLTIFKDAAATE